MSYSISEHIAETKERLADARAIAEACPDAEEGALPDGRRVWMSETVQPGLLEAVPGPGRPILVAYAVFPNGTRVYKRSAVGSQSDATTLLNGLAKTHPEAYGRLLRGACAYR